MMMMAMGFSALSLILVQAFYRKYQDRLRQEASDALRYNRIADYYCRPIPLAFEYRYGEDGAGTTVEADVDEIFHYGRDYFLKGISPDGRHCHIYNWSRIINPRVRSVGRTLRSLEQLFVEAERHDSQAAA